MRAILNPGGYVLKLLRITISVVILGIVAFALRSLISSQSSCEPTTDEPVADSTSVTLSDTLHAGESLYTSLRAKEIDAALVVRVLDVLGKEVNLKSCMPGDCYSVTLGSEGVIERLIYRRGLRQYFEVRLDSTGYVVKKTEIPLVGAMRRIEGVVETSLWDAFVEIGENPEIALKLADVFAWEIDFLTDTRKGDTFTIIVEEIYCDGQFVEFGDIYAARYVNDGVEHLGFRFVGKDGRVGYYDYDGQSLKRVFLKSPLNYRRISSYFSRRRFHPILKVYRPHYGVDYAAPTGTPVVSIGDGRVVYAGWKGGMGKYVEIRHNNVYTSCYGHLSRFARGIRKGVRVSQGQVIGYVGMTGLATGPHLDFRIKRFGSYVNPLTIKYPRAEPISDEELRDFASLRDSLLRALKRHDLASIDTTSYLQQSQ